MFPSQHHVHVPNMIVCIKIQLSTSKSVWIFTLCFLVISSHHAAFCRASSSCWVEIRQLFSHVHKAKCVIILLEARLARWLILIFVTWGHNPWHTSATTLIWNNHDLNLNENSSNKHIKETTGGKGNSIPNRSNTKPSKNINLIESFRTWTILKL